MTIHPDRIIPLPGCHNLRDLGGHATADGRTVRWRTLLRAGQMGPLADAELRRMLELRVAAICDLRSSSERLRHPTVWHAGLDLHYYSRDYENSLGELDALLKSGHFTADAARRAMHGIYAQLPYEQAPSYRELFRLLVHNRVPLIFNCTAGKDRTGVAAALLLSALGVPRETVEADYAMSNLAVEGLIALSAGDPRQTSDHPRDDGYAPLLRAEPEYLDTAFRAIDRRSGGLAGYMEAELGLSRADIDQLRDLLLE